MVTTPGPPREIGCTTPSKGYTLDPPRGLPVTIGDSYGRPIQVSHGGGLVTLILPGGGAREFGPHSLAALIQACVDAERAEEAVTEVAAGG